MKNLQNPLIFLPNPFVNYNGKSKDFGGFSSCRGSISELRQDFWSRSVLKHIPQVYTFDSARFRTISVRSRDTATLFGLNPPLSRFLNYVASYGDFFKFVKFQKGFTSDISMSSPSRQLCEKKWSSPQIALNSWPSSLRNRTCTFEPAYSD